MDSGEEEGVRVEEENGRGGLRRSRRASTKRTKYVDPLIDDDEDERPKRKGKTGGNRARKNPITDQVEASGSKPKEEKGYRAPKRSKKKDEIDGGEVSGKSIKKPRTTVDGKVNGYLPDNMCHQCQSSDKVVERCQNCNSKRYCHPCLKTWYPRIAKEDVAKKCPFCCSICNCRACLRLDTNIEGINSDLMVSEEEKIQSSKFILQRLLPHLKGINDEQIAEREIEAKISDVRPQYAESSPDERLYCDICKTSIFDLHRSCLVCSCDICLTCCLEIRNGLL